jgi:hypothetical protein
MIDILFRDVMAAKEGACGIGSIHLKTVDFAAMRGDETNVMEHGARIKKFGIELQTLALTSECSEIIDAAGVIEEESRFRIADELRDVVGELTVGDRDA